MCARIIQTTDVHALGQVYETDNALETPRKWNASANSAKSVVMTFRLDVAPALNADVLKRRWKSTGRS